MTLSKQMPLDYWAKNEYPNLTPLNVLAETVSEIRQPIDIIEAFCEILLQRGDLSEDAQTDVEMMADRAAYLRSVMEAALEYKNKHINLY